jgi:hypothetical protein
MVFGRAKSVSAALVVLAFAGCVDRRFVIESNVPNAQVFIDNKSIGAAPAHSRFEYYGYYTITLVQPGYETLTERVHVTAPWYAYPPFDFLAEVVWPFHIRDTRRYYFDLHEATKTRVEDLVNNADSLRAQGWALPQAERPAAPKPKPAPPDQPIPVLPPVGPGTVVPPGVGPGGAELVPSVRP